MFGSKRSVTKDTTLSRIEELKSNPGKLYEMLRYLGLSAGVPKYPLLHGLFVRRSTGKLFSGGYTSYEVSTENTDLMSTQEVFYTPSMETTISTFWYIKNEELKHEILRSLVESYESKKEMEEVRKKEDELNKKKKEEDILLSLLSAKDSYE